MHKFDPAWYDSAIECEDGRITMNRHKIFRSLLIGGLLVAMSQTTMAGGYHHHGYHHHDYGGALAAGLIIGGLFGYAIGESQDHYRSYGYRSYYSDYPPPTTVVYQRVERVPVVVREAPAPASEFSGTDCLMTREYTTTIKINGVEREAYGTRCMTAGGGWILGQPKLMPEY